MAPCRRRPRDGVRTIRLGFLGAWRFRCETPARAPWFPWISLEVLADISPPYTRQFPCTDDINEAVTAPRPTAWAINRILALLFVLGPPEGAHAVLLLDRAGWHTTSKLVVPENITPIFLPSRAPELNPVENIWQYLRQNWLAKHRLRELRRHRGRGPRRCGESSSPTPNGSHPLECENGQTSVSPYDRWYKGDLCAERHGLRALFLIPWLGLWNRGEHGAASDRSRNSCICKF